MAHGVGRSSPCIDRDAGRSMASGARDGPGTHTCADFHGRPGWRPDMFGRIVLVGTAISASAAAGFVVARREWRTWGIDADEAARALPGDDLVADATAVETRGIDLDAPPEAVWPWLTQMGY